MTGRPDRPSLLSAAMQDAGLSVPVRAADYFSGADPALEAATSR